MATSVFWDLGDVPPRYRRFFTEAWTSRGMGITLRLRPGIRIATVESKYGSKYGSTFQRNWTWVPEADYGLIELGKPTAQYGDVHRFYVARPNGKKPTASDVTRAVQFAAFVPCFCGECVKRRTSGAYAEYSIHTRNGEVLSDDQYLLYATVAEANGIDRATAEGLDTAYSRVLALLREHENPTTPEPEPFAEPVPVPVPEPVHVPVPEAVLVPAPVPVVEPEPAFDTYGIGFDPDPEFLNLAA